MFALLILIGLLRIWRLPSPCVIIGHVLIIQNCPALEIDNNKVVKKRAINTCLTSPSWTNKQFIANGNSSYACKFTRHK